MATETGERVRWWRGLALGFVLGVAGYLAYHYGYNRAIELYTGVVNRPLVYGSSQKLSDAEFETLADQLTLELRRQRARALVDPDEEDEPFARQAKTALLMRTRSFQQETGFPHIDYFRKAGVRQYEGPKTCLQCHDTMKVHTPRGVHEVETLEDVVESVHFKFQQTAPGFTTYGYDGREVNAEGHRPIPVGKIDRACGIPGTFSWTGWAELVTTRPHQSAQGEPAAAAGGEQAVARKGVVRSEGCGQCHIGGNYHPATEAMLPLAPIPESARQGIDCLICHSRSYDMNFRFVIEDAGGRRWNQDRSMEAAMTVGMPTRDNCLYCHQHNLGGDMFAENVSSQNLGYMNQRLLHTGSKRATPFSPDTDVHAAAGLTCTDCHVPEGHKIPRGTKGTDLVANDLPGKPVECESCHTTSPHLQGEDAAILNGHGERVSCEACHIKRLEETSVVLRDWVHPTWNEEEGLYAPTDIYRSGKPGEGVVYLWFNGNGTFLANALGDNPMGGSGYDPLMTLMANIDDPESLAAIRSQVEKLKQHYPEIDVEAYVTAATQPLTQLSPRLLEKRQRMIQENIRPLMRQGKSRLYPFKLFNAQMYEDMGNEGPFGAMILPFDYATYYEQGDPVASVKAAVANPIVKRMYELPFKTYMMDEFMHYFGVERWSANYPLQGGELVKVEPRWMRQMGTLMVNHGISGEGRGCNQCHSRKGGILRFEELGYPAERIERLRNLPELR